MIGNDIVDLNYTLQTNNWRRKGYIDKIFSLEEQDYIFKSDNPDKMVWLLWSMKESTYKIAARQLGKSFFAPLKFKCRLDDNNGEVIFEERSFKTSSEINGEYISTFAVDNDNLGAVIIKENIRLHNHDYLTQHCEIRKAVLTKIAALKNIPASSFDIKNNSEGIPYIFYKNSFLCIPLSLSHHGMYASYTLLMIE